MKKIVLGFMALAISFASIAQSENGKHKGHRKGENKELRHKGGRGFEDMNLSDAQKSQVKTLNDNFRNQMKSLGADKSLSQDAQKEKRKALKTEHRTQLLALLTPEQKKQWEEKSKQHRVHGKDGKNFDRSKKNRKEVK